MNEKLEGTLNDVCSGIVVVVIITLAIFITVVMWFLYLPFSILRVVSKKLSPFKEIQNERR
jgi:hypothetical protein